MSLLCVAVLAAACAEGSEAEPRSQSTRRGDAGGPGSDLGDGFRVARGSALLGTVFPGLSPDKYHESSESASGNDVWSAVLRLKGNPIKVLNRYIGQARDLGFNGEAECRLSYRDGETVAPTDTLRSRGLRGLRCNAIGGAPGDGGNRPEELSIEVRRSALDADAAYDDYVMIRFALRPAGWPFVLPQGSFATLPAEWANGVPGPAKPPRLSRTGQRIKRGDPFANRPIDVVRGTRLLAPPGLPCPQRGGFDAVLEVSGDVDRVLDGYAAQFRKKAMRTERSTARFRGREATIDEGFGETGEYGAVAIEGDKGDTTYLHLWFCPTF